MIRTVGNLKLTSKRIRQVTKTLWISSLELSSREITLLERKREYGRARIEEVINYVLLCANSACS